MSTHHFDELKELDDGWIEEVVSGAVVQQGVDDRLKQVPFDDVAVVILVLQTDDPTHKTQGTLNRNKLSNIPECFHWCVCVHMGGGMVKSLVTEQTAECVWRIGDLQRARKVCLEFISMSTLPSRSLVMM